MTHNQQLIEQAVNLGVVIADPDIPKKLTIRLLQILDSYIRRELNSTPKNFYVDIYSLMNLEMDLYTVTKTGIHHPNLNTIFGAKVIIVGDIRQDYIGLGGTFPLNTRSVCLMEAKNGQVLPGTF